MKRHGCKSLILSCLLLLATVTLALAAEGEHHADATALLVDFLLRLVNFGLIAGVLYYFLRKPLRDGLANRSRNIAQALAEAERVREEAEAKFAEYDRKLSRANEEVAALADEIRAEAVKERDRILEEAKQLAAGIREEAGRTADQEISRAKLMLRQEAAKAAVTLAEEILRKGLTKDDQARLIDEYLQKVGELH